MHVRAVQARSPHESVEIDTNSRRNRELRRRTQAIESNRGAAGVFVLPINAYAPAQGRARRLRAMACLVMSLLLFALGSMAVQAAEYSIAPAPGWVLPQQPGAATPAHLRKTSDGVSYLLVDNQVRATRDSRTRFYRYVSQALNAKGVESIANLGVDFDPAWQKLELHALHVLRGGRVIDKLPNARIEVIQQEKELDELIYNGSKTVKVFLDDIRVGDVLDYSFSTTGRNPVFGGLEFGASDLQWGVPVARLHARLLVPADSAPVVRTRNTALQPQVSEHDGLRDYRWSMRDTPVLTVEEGAPDWYTPYAEVEWSAFADWAAVSRWAQPLYRTPARLGPALEAEVARIARTQATPTGRMLAVLRFVQHEVRYLGVETGRNTHAPNPPDQVFARRFGDCKDKALLMLSMLARLGVEAHPALVNTRARRGIGDRLPNPAAFDHVIVNARADGKAYWLDPTRPTQESEAAFVYQPDFQVALVVAPGTRGLVSMKGPGSRSRRSVHVLLDARGHFNQPVRFRVVTTYEGGAAEKERDELAGATLESMQQEFLQYYADSYPGIASAAPLQVADDKRHNRLVTTESYSISDIASKADPNGKRTVWIETPDVDELLRDPEAKLRKAPLALSFPLDVSQTTEVLLPEKWELKASEAAVEDPAFSFHRSVRPDADGRRLVIQDDFRSLADEVAAKEMSRYTANLARARGELGYSLYWTDALAPPPASVPVAGLFDRINWAVVLLGLFVIGACVQVARRAWRYDPPARGIVDPALAGINGWLLLYTFSVVLGPVSLLMSLWTNVAPMAMPRWSTLTAFGGSQYHPLWAPALLFEFAGHLALLVASVTLLLLYFRQRSSYPRLAVGFLAALCLFKGVDLAIASRLPGTTLTMEDWGEASRLLLSALIWGSYLLLSKRVRSTFVRRLREPAPAPLLVEIDLASGAAPAPAPRAFA